MTIAFTRTGGIAAMPALRVRATAFVRDGAGRVEADGYDRELSATEAAALAGDAVAALAEQDAGVTPPSRARDAFQYEFSIVLDSGEPRALSAGDDAPADSAAGRLVARARAEAAAILASRHP